MADPHRKGLQPIARAADDEAVGFATVLWNLSTTRASRVALMNDLYVAPSARGSGLAGRLIGCCLVESDALGIATLEWQTRPDNVGAQRIYERIGGRRSEWLTYELATGNGAWMPELQSEFAGASGAARTADSGTRAAGGRPSR